MGDANGVVVDPNALNTFAHGLAQTTSTLAHQAAGEVPALTGEMGKAESMLTEGQNFIVQHNNTALQFMTFLQDATAGIGALSDGADVIALNYANTDLMSAAALLKVDPHQDPFSAASLLQLVPVGGSSAQDDATALDVENVFNPSAAQANPVLAQFHSVATQAPAPPPARGTLPESAAKGRSAIDEARLLAAQVSSVPGESDLVSTTKPSTYHLAHPVTPPDGVTMPALTVPGDATSQKDVDRSGEVHGGSYDGEDGLGLQNALTQMITPPSQH